MERWGITEDVKSKWEKKRRKFMVERGIRQREVRGKGREQIWGRNVRRKSSKRKKERTA